MAYINDGHIYLVTETTGIVNIDIEMSDTSENPVQNKVITKKFNDLICSGKNLYNNAKRTNDIACSNVSTQIIGEEATTVEVGAHAISEWIAVEENETYIFSNSYSGNIKYRVQVVDENNILVIDYFDISRLSAFEIPAGAKKLRFSNKQEIMDTTQLEKGSKATDYEEYKTLLKDECLPDIAIKNGFKGKTILFDGDSITAGDGFTTVEKSSIIYPQLVGKELGMNVVNNAIGGSALASNPDNETRNPLVIRYANDTTEADIVYIAIGTNDWAYQYTPIGTMEDRVTTTFYGALHSLCEGLINKYPNATIVFATPIKRKVLPAHTSPTEYLRNGKTLKEYGEIIKEVCDFYSIPVIDMYSECSITPFVDSQRERYFQETSGAGVHPNALGQEVMAKRVVAGLRSIIGF